MTNSPFTGLCPLCGARTRGSYCWAHSWAAGEGREPKDVPFEVVKQWVDPVKRKPASKRAASSAPLELVAGASTGSGRRLVARRTG